MLRCATYPVLYRVSCAATTSATIGQQAETYYDEGTVSEALSRWASKIKRDPQQRHSFWVLCPENKRGAFKQLFKQAFTEKLSTIEFKELALDPQLYAGTHFFPDNRAKQGLILDPDKRTIVFATGFEAIAHHGNGAQPSTHCHSQDMQEPKPSHGGQPMTPDGFVVVTFVSPQQRHLLGQDQFKSGIIEFSE